MGLPALTSDETYIRRYFLAAEPPRVQQFVHELQYLAPAVIMAAYALYRGAHDAMWIAFIYLFAVYVWRTGSSRWNNATRSLIQKYEARIAELEPSSIC
jgi:hypothetical protein